MKLLIQAIKQANKQTDRQRQAMQLYINLNVHHFLHLIRVKWSTSQT